MIAVRSKFLDDPDYLDRRTREEDSRRAEAAQARPIAAIQSLSELVAKSLTPILLSGAVVIAIAGLLLQGRAESINPLATTATYLSDSSLLADSTVGFDTDSTGVNASEPTFLGQAALNSIDRLGVRINVIEQRNVAMIGDSIFWGEGHGLRGRLSALNPHVRFVGSIRDSEGFRHEALPGESTRDVLDRAYRIVEAETYVILIGTNDRLTADESFENIRAIIGQIRSKSPESVVQVLTPLPRSDMPKLDVRNEQVAASIRQWIESTGDERLRLIDARREFEATTSWESLLEDGLHPNDSGYARLIEILSDALGA